MKAHDPVNSPVNSPAHYAFFPDLEAIDIIQRTLTQDEFIGYLKGNALKYRLRAGDKGDTLQDIDKSNWYRCRLGKVMPASDVSTDHFHATPEEDEAWVAVDFSTNGGRHV